MNKKQPGMTPLGYAHIDGDTGGPHEHASLPLRN